MILVARVAYLTSDVVLSVQPALQTDSLFSKPLKALKANKASNVLSKGVSEVGGPQFDLCRIHSDRWKYIIGGYSAKQRRPSPLCLPSPPEREHCLGCDELFGSPHLYSSSLPPGKLSLRDPCRPRTLPVPRLLCYQLDPPVWFHVSAL